jgi:hypothetical protein
MARFQAGLPVFSAYEQEGNRLGSIGVVPPLLPRNVLCDEVKLNSRLAKTIPINTDSRYIVNVNILRGWNCVLFPMKTVLKALGSLVILLVSGGAVSQSEFSPVVFSVFVLSSCSIVSGVSNGNFEGVFVQSGFSALRKAVLYPDHRRSRYENG